MQYYRGKALESRVDSCNEKLSGRGMGRSGAGGRIGRWLLFPFMLVFWTIENVIHKSTESDY